MAPMKRPLTPAERETRRMQLLGMRVIVGAYTTLSMIVLLGIFTWVAWNDTPWIAATGLSEDQRVFITWVLWCAIPSGIALIGLAAPPLLNHFTATTTEEP